jgi:hypothetical protein
MELKVLEEPKIAGNNGVPLEFDSFVPDPKRIECLRLGLILEGTDKAGTPNQGIRR